MRLSATRLTSIAQAGGGRTLIQRAISILRRYGQDAHIYLPGVGMLNGLQAGNYLDSAGTTVGTVDQPVGLVLDAAGSLGMELVTVPTVVAVPIGGPAFTSYAVGPATVAGKTYSVAFTVSDYSGTGNVSLDGGNGQWAVNPSATGDSSLAGNGTKSFIIQCVASALLSVFSRSTNTCTFSNISVREVTGIAASQPTTASKPILRRDAGGRYYWQFDGSNDSLSLGGPLFQMADDHCVVLCASRIATSGSERYPFISSGAGTIALAPAIAFGSDGVVKAYWRGDDNILRAASTGVAYISNVPIVATASKIGNSKKARVNAGAWAFNTDAIGAASITGSAIASRIDGTTPLDGNIYPVIAIKGTVTDPDLLLLEKFVGQLSGVQI